MVGDGADGEVVDLALRDLVVDRAHVFGLPSGAMPVADDDVGRPDGGPLEVPIGGFAHVAEAGLAAGGVDGWDEAAVAGQLPWRGEAIDGADLAVRDDGQDVRDTGKALEHLDRGDQCGAHPNTLFELSDLELQAVEGFGLLSDTSARLWGKPAEGRLERGPAGAGNDIAVLRAGDAVLRRGSVDAVLRGGAELRESAIRVRWGSRSSRISPGGSQTVGRLSRCRSMAGPLASSLSVLPKVPGMGVDIAHHDLGSGTVCQERQATFSLDLVGDPIPVPHALQGDGCTLRQGLEEGLDGAWLVIHLGLLPELAILIENSELRIATMGVATYSIMIHSCTSFTCLVGRHECSGRCSPFI